MKSSRTCTAKMSSLSKAILLTLAISMHSGIANAQSVQQDAAASESDKSGVEAVDLDAVTVTSTHKVKPLQKTPISIGVISAEQLDSANISNISDLQYMVPGLSYSGSATAANGGGFQVRGVGTQSYSTGAEQTVGTVVDDVVISLPRDPGVSGFSDVSHVEVLRGPQGTLFGKNASAGVVSINTNSPEIGLIESRFNLSLGERNEHVARFVHNLGLTDTMAVRLSGYYKEQDGAIPNVFHKWNAGDTEGNGLRGKFLWAPTEDLSITLTAERQNLFTRDPYVPYTLSSDPAAAAYVALFNGYENVGGDNFKSYADEDWFARQGVNGYSAKVVYDIDESTTFTSITAYRAMDFRQSADLDQSPANIINSSSSSMETDQISQEFRLAGVAMSDRLDYVLGAYYGKVETASDYQVYGAFSPPYPNPLPSFYVDVLGGIQVAGIKTESYALYANTSFAFSDRLSAILGARYTYDDVEGWLDPVYRTSIDGLPAIAAGVMLPSRNAVSKDNVSGRLGLQFQQNQDVMWYASVASGYKGPAINMTSLTTDVIAPEKSVAYEAGLKSQWFDRRVTFNASLFWSDFKDFQAEAFDVESTQYKLTSAGKMRSRGIELESSWKVTPDFTWSANAGYTDAEYREYLNACPIIGDVPCRVVDGVTVGDFKGQTPAFVSKYTFSTYGSYFKSFGKGLVFTANGGWSWKSSFYNTVGQSQTKTPAYGVVNGSIGIGAEDESWKVSLYARNLLDENYRTYLIYTSYFNQNGTFQHLSNDAFRTVGISLDLRF